MVNMAEPWVDMERLFLNRLKNMIGCRLHNLFMEEVVVTHQVLTVIRTLLVFSDHFFSAVAS
jgi:hypothetical protein